MSHPTQIYVVDIIGNVVIRTNAELTKTTNKFGKTITPVLTTPINYIYDRSEMITKELLEIGKQGQLGTKKKYPLVALVMDFPEVKGGTEFYSVATLKIIIATISDLNWKAKTRYDNNFKPILYPIYNELLRQLGLNGSIVGNAPVQFKHTHWDRPGTLPATKDKAFNDYIDAIEIENLQLTFIKNC